MEFRAIFILERDMFFALKFQFITSFPAINFVIFLRRVNRVISESGRGEERRFIGNNTIAGRALVFYEDELCLYYRSVLAFSLFRVLFVDFPERLWYQFKIDCGFAAGRYSVASERTAARRETSVHICHKNVRGERSANIKVKLIKRNVHFRRENVTLRERGRKIFPTFFS